MLLQLLNNYKIQLLFFTAIIFLCYFPYKTVIKCKKQLSSSKSGLSELTFQALDYYRITNIYFSICKLCFYLLCNIGLILNLRYSYLNTSIVLTQVNPSTIMSSTLIYFFIIIIIIICCFIYYMKILKEVTLFEISRLFIYYYHPKYKFYDIVSDIFTERFILTSLLVRFDMFLEEAIPRLKNKWFSKIAYKLSSAISFCVNFYMGYINIIFYQSSLVILILIILYDIINQKIYYTYYGLMSYYIISLISSIKGFFGSVPLGEVELHEYFYGGFYARTASAEEYKILYDKVETGYQMNQEELILMRMRARQIEYLPFVLEWIELITSGLKNRYVREHGPKNSRKFLTLPVRRIWLLLFFILGGVNSFYYDRINIIINNTTLDNNALLIIILYSTFFLWYKTGYRQKKDNQGSYTFIVENYGPKLYHRLFYIITCSMILFYLIIFFYNNVPLIMTDYFINVPLFKIKFCYSLKEKTTLFGVYLEAFLRLFVTPENVNYHKVILLQCNIQEHIKETMTIVEIKEFAIHIVTATMFLEENFFQLAKVLFIEDYNQEYLDRKALIKAIMNSISNITILTVFSSFFTAGIKAWHIAANPSSEKTIKLVQFIMKFYYYYRK